MTFDPTPADKPEMWIPISDTDTDDVILTETSAVHRNNFITHTVQLSTAKVQTSA